MKKFYIYDANGKYMSEDGQQRFSLLTGKALYDYLQTPEGKSKFFYTSLDDNGDEIGIEVPAHARAKFKAEKRREYYLKESKEQSGYTFVPLTAAENDEGEELSGEEIIADEDADVQKEVFKKMDLDTLRFALTQLNEDEMALISAMYLSEKPLTVREYAKELGIGVMTVCDRKNAILKKLKTFF